MLGAVTWFGQWGYLWRDWFTSIDHKKIGIMYIVLGIVMLLRGFADAMMMRTQQAISFGATQGYLPPHHYDQIFTAHGVIMIFFVAMPLRDRPHELRRAAADRRARRGLPVPEQLQLLDDALAARCSPWLSLFVGEFARTGWLAYPPLSGCGTVRTSGVDYYIWSLQIAGVGTTLSGINLIATIIKMRAPGMTHDEDAGVLLDGAVHQRPDRRDLPGADRDAGAALARPLRRHATSSRTTSAATR